MTFYILDTDHVPLHQRSHQLITRKILSYSPDNIAVSVVTVEEQMRGRLAAIGRKRDPSPAYERLRKTQDYFCGFTILPFTASAEHHF